MAKQVHKLTEAAVEKAKAGDDRREIADGGGLYLVVHATGAKNWAVRYRHNGESRKYVIPGFYPAIDLKAARSAAKAALQKVAHGGDPSKDKARARVLAADKSTVYPLVAAQFLKLVLTRGKKPRRPRPRTLEELARLLGMVRNGEDWEAKGGLADKWKAKKVAEITKRDVLDHLEGMVSKGIGANTNRSLAALHQFFGWCQRRELILSNPCSGIDPQVEETPRSRVLTDAELALAWEAAGDDRLFGPYYRLLILTGQRRDEVRGMKWSEIDLQTRTWTIPGSRTKNHHEHVVPLSAPAVEILKALPRIGGAGYVFTTTGESYLGGLSRAKARLDKAMLAKAREKNRKAKIEHWTVHDIRRSVASGLQKLTPPHVIELILNHSSGIYGGIVGVYQRDKLEADKRAALDAWARHIQAITGEIAGNVIEMKAAR